jgi:hypothetical protein
MSSIIAQAPVALANTVVAAGTGSIQLQYLANNSAGLTGNFCLALPANPKVGLAPIKIKAQGYVIKGVTSTMSIGLTWGKTQATATTAMFTVVASASMTGANPPVLPTNAYPWQIQQEVLLDATSQTASAIGGPGPAGSTLNAGTIWVGAATVAIVAGVPPTQLTTVGFNAFSLPALSTGINQSPTSNANSVFFGLTYLNATSDTSTLGQFVVTSFYAQQD